MPRAVTVLPYDVETITRPVTMGVIRELLRILRLDDGPVEVVYSGGTEAMAQPGSNVDGSNEAPKFGHNAQLKVEVQERAIEDRVLAMSVQNNDHSPVFHDENLGVRLTPIYAMHEVQLQATYRAKSRAEAQRFRHDMLVRVAQLRDVQPQQMTYSYAIPYDYLNLLLHIHTLREAQAGYGQDFNEWLSCNLDVRSTQLVNMAGQYPELRIPENQIHNWGAFSEFLPAADPADKNGNSGTWLINFSYRFQYDKPIACRAEWPLMVHNQLVSGPWIHEQNASGEQIDPWRQKHHSSRVRHAMDVVAELYDRPCVTGYREAIVPSIDEWSTRLLRPDTAGIAQVLVQAVGEDPHDVFNLRDLPEIEFDADVLEFLKTESRWLNKYGESIFHVSFYENDRPQSDDIIHVTPFLAIRTTNPMDLRKVYHVRLELLWDLFSLRPSALTRLSQGGLGAWKLLMDMQFRMSDRAYRPRLLNDQYIPIEDIRIIARRMLELKRPLSGSREAIPLTVGNYTVVTRRMNEYQEQSHASSNNQTGTGGQHESAGCGEGSSGSDSDGQIVSRCCG